MEDRDSDSARIEAHRKLHSTGAIRPGLFEASERVIAELRKQNAQLRDALEWTIDDSREILENYKCLYGDTYRPDRVAAQQSCVDKAEAALRDTGPANA